MQPLLAQYAQRVFRIVAGNHGHARADRPIHLLVGIGALAPRVHAKAAHLFAELGRNVAHFPTRAIHRLTRMRVEIHHIALRETLSQHAVLLKRIAQYGLVITPAVMLCGNFILLAFDDFVSYFSICSPL